MTTIRLFFFQIRAYFSSFWKRAGETSPLSSCASVPKEKHVSFKQVSLLTNWITKSRKNFNLGTTATRNQFANSLLSKKLQRCNQEVFLVIFTKLVEKNTFIRPGYYRTKCYKKYHNEESENLFLIGWSSRFGNNNNCSYRRRRYTYSRNTGFHVISVFSSSWQLTEIAYIVCVCICECVFILFHRGGIF